jgi:hypothetical protein
MVKIIASPDTARITIVGHGISIDAAFALDDVVTLIPTPPATDLDVVALNSSRFEDYVAVVAGREVASFAIQVSGASDANDLAVRGWNALWVFHLLSLAAGAPCMPLFSVSEGLVPTYSLANRTPIIRPVEKTQVVSLDRLSWARAHEGRFSGLINDPQFSAAMLCYGNAHYLPDLKVRIMLLWAGIEGLLAVDSELNRRLALYATLLMQGSVEEKSIYFAKVKRAYGLRSKAVHGAHLPPAKLQEGYIVASTILVELLARCVELGRVPSQDEFDRAALRGVIS